MDDDKDLLEELADALALEGFPAVAAVSAADAAACLMREPSITYVVTDLMIPGTGGLELIRKIAGLRPQGQIRCIVMSGAATLDDAVSAIRHGAMDFLHKPVTGDKITRVLRSHESLPGAAAGIRVATPSARSEIPDRLLTVEKERRKLFRGDLVGDPVWEMLLDLASASERGEAVALTSLCVGAGLPYRTGLRRLDDLERLGLIERQTSIADRRRVMGRLTPLGQERMQACLGHFGKRFAPLPSAAQGPSGLSAADLVNPEGDAGCRLHSTAGGQS